MVQQDQNIVMIQRSLELRIGGLKFILTEFS